MVRPSTNLPRKTSASRLSCASSSSIALDRTLLVTLLSARGSRLPSMEARSIWIRSRKAILEYVEQTALITPYANITFIDPQGTVYYYPRTVKKLPPLPREVLPHPYGIDVEQLRRIIDITKCKNMIDFLTTHFHRVGKTTAKNFLAITKISPDRDPHSLEGREFVELVENMKKFKVIMSSMTNDELDGKIKLGSTRIQRIARGSGRSIAEVKELINQHKMMTNLVKKMRKGRRGGMQIPGMPPGMLG